MRTQHIIPAILIAFLLPFLGLGQSQCNQITRQQLRTTLVQLGYDVKDLETTAGKEKYSLVVTREGLDIPIALEISANLKYIWLTVYLNMAKSSSDTTNFALLKQNAIIQPCQFYITQSGKLMMGLPIENCALTNAVLRDKIESVAGHVSDTKSLWQ